MRNPALKNIRDETTGLDLDGVDVSASHRALTSLTPEMGSIFADFKRALAEEDGADKELSRARAGEVFIKKARRASRKRALVQF